VEDLFIAIRVDLHTGVFLFALRSRSRIAGVSHVARFATAADVVKCCGSRDMR
jgi:hypothetical protein